MLPDNEDAEAVRILADKLRPAMRHPGGSKRNSGATALAYWTIHTERSLSILLAQLRAMQSLTLNEVELEALLTDIRYEFEHILTHTGCHRFLDGVIPQEATAPGPDAPLPIAGSRSVGASFRADGRREAIDAGPAV
jgi:hypothetical protein